MTEGHYVCSLRDCAPRVLMFCDTASGFTNAQACSFWAKREELAMPPVPVSYQSGIATEKELARTSRVLLLSPSRGLGGGIERYVEALEWAIIGQGTSCQRIDLSRAGIRAHSTMLARGQTLLRASSEPVRLVVGHRALLPVATFLAREPTVCGIWVLGYGLEVWSAGLRPRRMLEHS